MSAGGKKILSLREQRTDLRKMETVLFCQVLASAPFTLNWNHTKIVEPLLLAPESETTFSTFADFFWNNGLKSLNHFSSLISVTTETLCFFFFKETLRPLPVIPAIFFCGTTSSVVPDSASFFADRR